MMSRPTSINAAAQMAAALLMHDQQDDARNVLAQVGFDPAVDDVDKESLKGKTALVNALAVSYLLDKRMEQLRQAAEIAITIMAESFEAAIIVILYLCEAHDGHDCDLVTQAMIAQAIEAHHHNPHAYKRLKEVAQELPSAA